jgi:type VI secretion system secreted protein Hcp
MLPSQKLLRKLLTAAAVAATPAAALAAQPVYLFLKANDVDIQGEPSVVSLGRANSIECVGFHVALQAGSAPAATVLTCKKRIDKASPLLVKALAEQQSLVFTFRFYRPNPVGDGTTEQFFTVASAPAGARLVSLEQVSPSAVDADTSGLPALESISIRVPGALCFSSSGGTAYCTP